MRAFERGICEAADPPKEIAEGRDEKGNTTARGKRNVARIVAIGAAVTKPGDGDIDRENNKGGAYKAFADGVEAGWDREVKGNDQDSEDGNSESMADSVKQA